MYLIVIQVPFQEVSTGLARVASDWGRSLRLLRDSFQGRYGPITVAAPALPSDFRWVEQQPMELAVQDEDISFVRLCDANLRTRQFWPRALSVFRRCLVLARQAEVVHAGMSDLYRPIAQLGFYAALKAGAPTVFVEDVDAARRLRDLANGRSRWRTELYCRIYDLVMRHAVARADLSLLKGHSLQNRFGKFAKNPMDFHDTSYSTSWVIPENELDQKIAELATASVLRCVSVGRLIARKGVDETLRVVAALNGMGVPTELDVIGDGPARAPLQLMVRQADLQSGVRFLGARKYGSDLMQHLRQYHLMLFTPLAEETPRSVFDALAAGVPIAAYRIRYVESLIENERCGLAAPIRGVEELSRKIRELWSDRSRFAQLTRQAARAGRDNAAERWYARRAERTNAAVPWRSGFGRPTYL